MKRCSSCNKNVSNSAKYCSACGRKNLSIQPVNTRSRTTTPVTRTPPANNKSRAITPATSLATTPRRSHTSVAKSSSSISIEQFASTVKDSAKSLVEYADKNGGKVKVSAEVGNTKISTSYNSNTSKITYASNTSYTPRISCNTPKTSQSTSRTPKKSPSTSRTPKTPFGTVAKSSSSVSIGQIANTIKESAKTLIEIADRVGGKVKVTSQIGDVKISTSYTPETNRSVRTVTQINIRK